MPRINIARSRELLIIALTIVFCSLTCLGMFVAQDIGVFRLNPQPPGRDLEELFVKAESFPDDWTLSNEPPSSPCRAAPLGSGCESSISLSMRYQYTEFPWGGAVQSIYQYLNDEEASKDFERMEKRSFSVNEEFGTPWSIPDDLSFSSESSQQYRLGCHFHGPGERCQLLARYQELIILFSIRRSILDDDRQIELLSYDQLQAVLRSLDAHITSELTDANFQ